MLKRILFAAAVTGLLAGAALPLQSGSAEAASGCRQAAKAKFPGTGMFKERHSFRKYCRQQYRAHKAAMKSAG